MVIRVKFTQKTANFSRSPNDDKQGNAVVLAAGIKKAAVLVALLDMNVNCLWPFLANGVEKNCHAMPLRQH